MKRSILTHPTPVECVTSETDFLIFQNHQVAVLFEDVFLVLHVGLALVDLGAAIQRAAGEVARVRVARGVN